MAVEAEIFKEYDRRAILVRRRHVTELTRRPGTAAAINLDKGDHSRETIPILDRAQLNDLVLRQTNSSPQLIENPRPARISDIDGQRTTMTTKMKEEVDVGRLLAMKRVRRTTMKRDLPVRTVPHRPAPTRHLRPFRGRNRVRQQLRTRSQRRRKPLRR